MNNKTLKKSLFLVILLFLLVIVNFAQAPINQKPTEKPERAIKESNYEDIIRTIAQDISSQTTNISNIILILSIIMGLIVISIPFLMWFLEKRQSEEINRNLDLFKSRIEFVEKNVQRTIEGIESRLENQLLNELKEKMDTIGKRQGREMKEQFDNYRGLLLERLDFNMEPMDERLLQAEIVRFSIWYKLLPGINRAIQGENWMQYIEVWNSYHKLNLALAEVLSSRVENICTGLGKFLDLTPQGIVPQSLWNLILLLKEQNRLQDSRVLNMVQRLGRVMERSLDERSTELDESEDLR